MKIPIRIRLLAIAVIPLIITIVILTFFSISSLRTSAELSIEQYRKSLLDSKKEALKLETEIAIKTIRKFFNDADSEASKQAAMAMIKNQTFGKSGYFWINDYYPNMVMHPIKPSLNGKSLREFKDPNGVYLFNEFVKTVKENGMK